MLDMVSPVITPAIVVACSSVGQSSNVRISEPILNCWNYLWLFKYRCEWMDSTHFYGTTIVQSDAKTMSALGALYGEHPPSVWLRVGFPF